MVLRARRVVRDARRQFPRLPNHGSLRLERRRQDLIARRGHAPATRRRGSRERCRARFAALPARRLLGLEPRRSAGGAPARGARRSREDRARPRSSLARGRARRRARGVAGAVGGQLLVVLDQLEELFAYRDRPDDEVVEELTAALRRRDPAVHFLLSIPRTRSRASTASRATSPAWASTCCGSSTSTGTVRRGRSRAARALEPGGRRRRREGGDRALVEAVLEQVTAGKVSLGDTAARPENKGASRRPISSSSSLASGTRSGGVDRGSSACRRSSGSVAPTGSSNASRYRARGASVTGPGRRRGGLPLLVTPSEQDRPPVSDLADYTERSLAQIEDVVDRLSGDVRILRPAGDGRYEIYHDALAGPIADWGRPRRNGKRAAASAGGSRLPRESWPRWP